MSYLKHEPDLGDKCGCANCDLAAQYLKQYDAFKSRKPYRVLDCNLSNLEDELNKLNSEGYEMTAVVKDAVVMRSVPPSPPNNIDVIKEIERRQEETGNREGQINLEDFNPIGEA